MSDEKSHAAADTEVSVEESCARIGAEFRNLLRALVPSESEAARKHFRAARIEVLKGFRAAIDARIERLTSDQQKGTSVTVE